MLIVSDLATNVVGKFDLELTLGFNLISLPLIPTSTDIDDVISNQLTGGLVFSADGIYNRDGDKAFLATDGTWKDASAPTEASDLTIDPDQGYFIEVKAASPDPVTVVGTVSTTNRTIVVSQGFNLIGTAFPVSVALDNSNLFVSGANPGAIFNADGIYNPAGEKAFLSSADNQWHDAASGNLSDMELSPGQGYFFEAKDAGFTWTYTKPY